jgi:hypothetical protein
MSSSDLTREIQAQSTPELSLSGARSARDVQSEEERPLFRSVSPPVELVERNTLAKKT